MFSLAWHKGKNKWKLLVEPHQHQHFYCIKVQESIKIMSVMPLLQTVSLIIVFPLGGTILKVSNVQTGTYVGHNYLITELMGSL